MFLKVSITGHTKGIGKAVKKMFESISYAVVGLSRSNRFCLEKDFDKVRSSIIRYDPDIFVNNCYVPNLQTKLLCSIYEEWKFKQKLIINIGSVAALLPNDSIYEHDYNSEYASNKRKQREFCEQNNLDFSKKKFDFIKCGLSNINCDYVNTDFKSKYDKKLFPNLQPYEVASVVKFITECFFNGISIRELNFHSNKPPLYSGKK